MNTRDHWIAKLKQQIEQAQADFAATKAKGGSMDELRSLVDKKKLLVTQVSTLENGGAEAYKVIEKLQTQESNARLAEIKQITDAEKAKPREARAEARAERGAKRAEIEAQKAAEREKNRAASQESRQTQQAEREAAREAQRAEAELERRQKEDSANKRVSQSGSGKTEKTKTSTTVAVPTVDLDLRVKAAAERAQKTANTAAGLAAAGTPRPGFGKK